MNTRAIRSQAETAAARAAEALAGTSEGRPRVFFAPGRFNIIGEHTDYSGGLAMPAALDLGCAVAFAPATASAARLTALDYDDSIPFPPIFTRRGDWSDYVSGCAEVLRSDGLILPPCNMAIASCLPQGLGLSSSAALGVASLLALCAAAGRTLPRMDLARLAQLSENRHVGVPCGILDPFASLHGQTDTALLLDCSDLSFAPVALPSGIAFLIVDSGVRRQLRDGGYAARRQDCEEAASALGLRWLRDAAPDDAVSARLSPRQQRRVRHVISENARVTAMRHALLSGDCDAAGRLLCDSHRSLRDDFDVTCEATDRLCELLSGASGVFGARQMGGGFGGCVIAIAAEDAVPAILEICAVAGFTAGFSCRAGSGAREILL
jgi:galactokinase